MIKTVIQFFFYKMIKSIKNLILKGLTNKMIKFDFRSSNIIIKAKCIFYIMHQYIIPRFTTTTSSFANSSIQNTK